MCVRVCTTRGFSASCCFSRCCKKWRVEKKLQRVIVVARWAGFAPTVTWPKMYGWQPKMDISRSNRSLGVSFRLVCSYFYTKNAWIGERSWAICFSQIWWGQSPAWKPDSRPAADRQPNVTAGKNSYRRFRRAMPEAASCDIITILERININSL